MRKVLAVLFVCLGCILAQAQPTPSVEKSKTENITVCPSQTVPSLNYQTERDNTPQIVYKVEMKSPPPKCVSRGTCPKTAAVLKALLNYGAIVIDDNGDVDGADRDPNVLKNDPDLAHLRNLVFSLVGVK